MSDLANSSVTFRPFANADIDACLAIFDANCPEYFAPNEREEYQQFLERAPDRYEICEADGRVLGAFGLFDDGPDNKVLNWILLNPQSHGLGVGSSIMARVIQLGRSADTSGIRIAASQKSAPFFARFGAQTTSITTDGWGSGMHRVDMLLSL